jgi:hypothetical protein
MVAVSTQEDRWAAAERTLDVQAARRVRRTPWVVIGLTGLLVVAVAITAAVDLRRLQTPRGAALAWTEAATFGDCRGFLALSVVADPTQERRTDDEICRSLRRTTESARANATRITLTARSVARQGGSAVARIEVRTPEGIRTVTLTLTRRDSDWLVLRSAGACGELACY